jgi:hypothetical protein
MTSPISLALLAALAVLALGAGGCARDSRQTTVVSETKSSAGGSLTPLERGALRRDVNRAARAGIAAFLGDDDAKIRAAFTKEWADYWAKARAENALARRTRVRKHKLQSLDVTQFNENGTQALVEYYFDDQSYYTDASGRRIDQTATATQSPAGASKMFQLTLDKTDRGWVISRVIGATESMK